MISYMIRTMKNILKYHMISWGTKVPDGGLGVALFPRLRTASDKSKIKWNEEHKSWEQLHTASVSFS